MLGDNARAASILFMEEQYTLHTTHYTLPWDFWRMQTWCKPSVKPVASGTKGEIGLLTAV